MPSNIYPPAIIKSQITRTGAVGPPGPNGVDGQPGPNLVTGDTDTDITGPLFGNGSKVRAATADEVISSTALQAALARFNSFADFLAGDSTDTVTIADEIYTVPNNTTVDAELRGASRKWIGGYFVRNNAATADHGIVIQNTAGAKYVRQWDGVNIVPEFYRIGLGGLRNDTDAINAAALQLPNGGVITLQRKKTYYGKTVQIEQGTTLTGGTIKRIALSQTTLSAQATAGTTTITVSDASAFRIGMNIQIADGVGYDDTASGSSTYYIINNIVGNVITLHVATTNTMPIGAKVFEHCYQLTCVDQVVTRTEVDIHIRGVNFDGNNTQNNATHSWTLNNCIHIASYFNCVWIEDCKFYDMPSEVMTLAGEGWVSRCRFEDVYGSCVHGSATGDTTNKGVVIDSCIANNICISTAQENGHGSFFGFYTQSNATRDIHISKCQLRELNNGFIVSHRTPGIVIDDCYVENARGIHWEISGSEVGLAARITNNKFVNAGNIVSGGAGTDWLADGLVFAGNTCLNTSAKFVGNKNAVVANNTFRWNSDYQSRMTAGEIDSIGRNDGITIGGQIEFIGNTLINEDSTAASLTVGVFVQANMAFTPRTKVACNTIEGFSVGIETGSQSQTSPIANAVVIEDNTIVIPTMAGTRRGILSFYSGARIAGNSITASSSASAIGIHAQGVNTDVTATLIAGEVVGNTVIGCANWLQTTWYDNIISNNVYDGSYWHTTSSTRQRQGMNTRLATEYGSRVAVSEATGPVVGRLFRHSTVGGYLIQDATGWGAYSSGDALIGFVGNRFLFGAAIADASAPNNCIYPSSTQGKLVYKDSSGVVNALY